MTTNRKTKRVETPLIGVQFRISRSTLERFREVAQGNERTVSQELRWLVERRIAEAEQAELIAA